MANDHGTNGNARLESLRQRESALRAQITAEKERLERRRQRELTRHAMILGTCLLAELKDDPNMGRLLEETLKQYSNPHDAEFLRAKGWRI